MREQCPACGAPVPAARGTIAVGRVLALVGGLAIVAAFFMPWFEVQRLIMTGQFLNDFLAGTTDLRQFLPGFTSGPGQVAQLRALVLLFPVCGALATLMAVLGATLPRARRPIDAVLVLAGLVALAALAAGLTQLPAGARVHVGLWLIGAGGAAILLGVALERVLTRPPDPPRTAGGTD